MDLINVEKFLTDLGQPEFRLAQIKRAYFVDLVDSFEEFFTLPKDLREKLAKNFSFSSVQLERTQKTKDQRTQKVLLKLSDGLKIETVLMDYDGWLTACLSVAVGCPLGCLFCATGKMGFKRNLTSEEIVDQVVFWNRQLKPSGRKVSHLVYMGMGEPFLNWDDLWEAIKIIQDKNGLNIGDRKISISTAGIIEKINQFSQMNTQINLAISLHSPFQQKREKLMPVTRTNPLDKLMAACLDYVKKTGRKLFFECALMAGENDSEEDAKMLCKLLKKSYLFHLNLIRLNKVIGGLKPTLPETEKKFLRILDREHLPYTFRKSFGREITAACGQLAS